MFKLIDKTIGLRVSPEEELEGLDKPPYPGAKGQEIYDTISKKAWTEWTNHQTMLINEKPYTGLTPERVHDIISDYISNS